MNKICHKCHRLLIRDTYTVFVKIIFSQLRLRNLAKIMIKKLIFVLFYFLLFLMLFCLDSCAISCDLVIQNQRVPADMIFLRTTEKSGKTFVFQSVITAKSQHP